MDISWTFLIMEWIALLDLIRLWNFEEVTQDIFGILCCSLCAQAFPKIPNLLSGKFLAFHPQCFGPPRLLSIDVR